MATLTARTAVLAVALAAFATSPGLAQDHSEHKGQTAGAAGTATEMSEASKAYDAAMMKMHKDMSIQYSNDVDVDFVRGMIPHHQGAIEQAQILLKYSKNPRLRRLAGGIIAAQKREIRFMVKWLKEHDQGLETDEMPDWLRNNPDTPEAAEEAGKQ